MGRKLPLAIGSNRPFTASVLCAANVGPDHSDVGVVGGGVPMVALGATGTKGWPIPPWSRLARSSRS
jgi:hypothetical protein